jgi:hypothetical protein
MSEHSSKPRAVYGVEKRNAPGVLARATLMQLAILAAAATFASPPIAMSAFLALIEAAATAQSLAATRGKGLVTARNAKIDVLWTAMNTLKAYVQSLADTLDAVHAAALIESAGLLVAKKGAREKLLLAATYVPATGLVHLVVNATMLIGKRPTKKTMFTWSWSGDGGKTWSSGITNTYASADVPGLSPGSYLFRVQATVGKVIGEWSQTASLTIH